MCGPASELSGRSGVRYAQVPPRPRLRTFVANLGELADELGEGRLLRPDDPQDLILGVGELALGIGALGDLDDLPPSDLDGDTLR